MGRAPGVAKRFNISNQAAQKWRQRIPVNRVREVEIVTGISREILRPDVFGAPDEAAA